MKIKAHKEKCSGHARCAVVAPNIFDLDDDGYIAIGEIEVSPENEAMARRGVRACPERALEIIEE
ncbi:ferredoxin [Sphingobium sp. SCG-1]|uniref:ferredoxin n=1 Tax=Sphingobium sp. SCG-1 TaxID=2072936 RepID=UPI000CD6901C|nr:ferredoxin [Sphingobium sp. SCG-1]AUW57111.1 ferredoxin [Sphingobium sp. SCG-1]